ncbi:MFS transporter [Undibacterium terreum]|uniref:MFS transporter n=2 Tax=Undibacterium terreum TaxID=1224302 RepID=A0A916XNJ5_9BURK|nr:MFS transporter [Undibacterium terreum]
MIAPLLPSLASDFATSVTAVGQLVTVFALTYAVSSPILTALSGSIDRRKMLILSMLAFALSNVLAWHAHDYWTLMAARVLLAITAGFYVPNANALGGALVPPEKRGKALAIVNGGISIAVAIGVPLGAVIGHAFGWRMTFAGIGALALLASLGLIVGLRPGTGSGIPSASLQERFAVMKQPQVLLALLVTTLWATGAYTVYTYLTLFLATVAGVSSAHIGSVLFMWGIAAVIGIVIGGNLSDKLGPRAVILPSLVLLTLSFFALSLIADLLQPELALIPALIAIVAWGVSAWAFFPAQQARLFGIREAKLAPIVLSLNASFMYIGFSSGAALGSIIVAAGGVRNLGWIGGLCEIVALVLVIATTRRKQG